MNLSEFYYFKGVTEKTLHTIEEENIKMAKDVKRLVEDNTDQEIKLERHGQSITRLHATLIGLFFLLFLYFIENAEMVEKLIRVVTKYF